MALHNKFVIDLGFSIDCWLLFVVLAFHNLKGSLCICNNHPLSQNHSPLPWRIRMGRSDLRPSRSRSWKPPQPQTPPSKVMPNPPEPPALPPHQWCNLYPIEMMGSGKSSIDDALDWRMRNYTPECPPHKYFEPREKTPCAMRERRFWIQSIPMLFPPPDQSETRDPWNWKREEETGWDETRDDAMVLVGLRQWMVNGSECDWGAADW